MSTAPSDGSPSTPRTPRRISGGGRDRFIPSTASKDGLLLNKHPDRLSPREKLARTQSYGPDPFSSHVPRTPVRHRAGSSPASIGRGLSTTTTRRSSLTSPGRRMSQGAVWGIGGASASAGDSVAGIPDGRGRLLASGTNASLFSSNFLSHRDSNNELDVHERRLAVALELDTASRVLGYQGSPDSGYGSASPTRTSAPTTPLERAWRDGQWAQHTPTTILDAPSLRDDYYCSLLAYSPTIRSLAVGLGSHVYLWAESRTPATPESLRTSHTAHVTSLSFSSPDGGRGILAVGRADGRILLWSPTETEARWDAMQPNPICCVAFRPQPVKRPSIRDPYIDADTEELLIGDEAGHLYYYSIEWPSQNEKELWDWPGAMTLLLRITVHTQQICGVAWSPDGEYFATGGNDNLCYLFESRKILQRASATSDPTTSSEAKHRLFSSRGTSTHIPLSSNPSFTLNALVARHTFTLLAAVKAIAFCPWQRGLLALGGGSNDRCIHFFHTVTGAALAKIDCCAQVTSLIWSKTRREIAATFGFAQPEHRIRVAVFGWPGCECLVRIPWFDEHRALFAIGYPGSPGGGEGGMDGGRWRSRTKEEGCIVVATSDCSIKFHEVWADERRGGVVGRGGMLGGSDILESLHGIDKDGGEVIR